MNIENFEKWVAALQSGDFEQGEGYLVREGDKYCCLGVGCVVAGLDRHIYSESSMAPKELVDWLGLEVDEEYHEEGETYDIVLPEPDGTVCTTAATLNDKGKSFEQIAHWLLDNRDDLQARP